MKIKISPSKNTNVNGSFWKVTVLMNLLSTDTNSVRGFITMLDPNRLVLGFFRILSEISSIILEKWVSQLKTDQDFPFLTKRCFERVVRH